MNVGLSRARVALIAMAAVAGVRTASAEAAIDPLASFTGRWAPVTNQAEYGAEAACKDHWEQYAVSADRRSVTAGSAKGKKVEYRVLYAEGDTAAMYLNGEARRNAAGDRLIWVLIMETPDRFRWRIYGEASNPAEEAKFARVRCK